MITGKLLATAGILLALVSLSFTADAQTVAHAFVWTQNRGMQDLGTLQGWQDSAGTAISGSGQVVGNATLNTDITAPTIDSKRDVKPTYVHATLNNRLVSAWF